MSNTIDTQSALSMAAQMTLGILFLFAGLAKLRRTADFSITLGALGFSSRRLIRTLALWLPRIELALGAWLLSGMASDASIISAGLILLAFTALLVISVGRAKVVYCGCFGQMSRGRVTWLTVLRNATLLGLVVVLIARSSAPSASHWAQTGHVGDLTAIVIATSAVLLSIALLSEVRAGLRSSPPVSMGRYR